MIMQHTIIHNKIKLIKLDNRYSGSKFWKYAVEPSLSYHISKNLSLSGKSLKHVKIDKFLEWRKWCWQTWSDSKELSQWIIDSGRLDDTISQNENWCWMNDNEVARIYLRTDIELATFILNWA